jgi:hypothetical protein
MSVTHHRQNPIESINTILAALISGRILDVITQNGDCSREINMRTLVFRNKLRYLNGS